jgi:hypothetical protein
VLLVLHGDLWVTIAIDDSDGIPVGLCTIHHVAFEIRLLHAVFFYEFVELSLHIALDVCIPQLHVTYDNGHDLAIHCINTPLWSMLGQA